MEIPEFRLYGQGRPEVEEAIQPKLELRGWAELYEDEKETALQQLKNKHWVDDYSGQILSTIEYLNRQFLRECPGKSLHQIVPEGSRFDHSSNESARKEAAYKDFCGIFMAGSEPMVLRMLSKFTSCYIDSHSHSVARGAENADERNKYIERAFEKFDILANCLNHIFEQFAVNQFVTRNGFVPRQDDAITTSVYAPTLTALADPRWKPVSDDLAGAFQDFRDENYPEVITKSHAAVQRFLQILAGEEGKNAKGEVGKLYQEAKRNGLIPVNRFTENLMDAVQSFIVSERATNSTAKPAVKDATPSDALLVLNTVLVFLQFCLQAR